MIKKAFGCNILLAAPENFLAKYWEETYGINFGFSFDSAVDGIVSFRSLLEIIPRLEEETFLLIDEVDGFLFENPIATEQDEGGRTTTVCYKQELLRSPHIAGLIGLSGTFDSQFGVLALRRSLENLFYFRAPTMQNVEAKLNYSKGNTAGRYSFCQQDYLDALLEEVGQRLKEQPVIIVAADQMHADSVHEHLREALGEDADQFTNMALMGSGRIDLQYYRQALSKLEKYRQRDKLAVVITREASRGIDFQFKPGARPAHVIIAYPVDKPSELRQSIGRSCRQLGHDMPSWQLIIVEERPVLNDQIAIAMAERVESNLSQFVDSVWTSMAAVVHHLAVQAQQ